MDANFWHKRWKDDDIAFHESKVNALLVSHLKDLPIQKRAHIFVPLCGKTQAIAWLLSMGHKVTGIELNITAVNELFEELGVKPKIETIGTLQRYHAVDLDIFVGDIFALTRETIGSVDATFDRAALVALPQAMRSQYSQHLISITRAAPQLLIVYEYDQNLMKGPPFSISSQEIHDHYKKHYKITPLASSAVPQGLRNIRPVNENAFLLK